MSQIPTVHVGRPLISIIKSAYKSRIPLLVWGPPAIGKSACFEQAAEELGVGFIDIRLSQMDAADIAGLPQVFEDKDGRVKTRFATPDLFPNSGKGIVLFGEIAAADRLVQIATYKLWDVSNRGMNGYCLPDGWVPMGDSNRPEDNANVVGISSALRTRGLQVTAAPHVDYWKEWAYRNNIDHRIIGFVSHRNDMLYKWNPVEDEAGPTPRTWHLLSILLQHAPADHDVIASTVGVGAATEFLSWIKMESKLPTPQEILSQRKWYPKEGELDVAYAGVVSVVSHLLQMEEGDKFKASLENFLKWLVGWPESMSDFVMLGLGDLLRSGRQGLMDTVVRSKNCTKLIKKYDRLLSSINDMAAEGT